jgi:hypothetical protein
MEKIIDACWVSGKSKYFFKKVFSTKNKNTSQNTHPMTPKPT